MQPGINADRICYFIHKGEGSQIRLISTHQARQIINRPFLPRHPSDANEILTYAPSRCLCKQKIPDLLLQRGGAKDPDRTSRVASLPQGLPAVTKSGKGAH